MSEEAEEWQLLQQQTATRRRRLICSQLMTIISCPKVEWTLKTIFYHILINAWVQRRAKKKLRKRNIRNSSKTLTNAQAEFQCEGQQGKWSYVQHGEEENNNNKNSYNNKKKRRHRFALGSSCFSYAQVSYIILLFWFCSFFFLFSDTFCLPNLR